MATQRNATQIKANWCHHTIASSASPLDFDHSSRSPTFSLPAIHTLKKSVILSPLEKRIDHTSSSSSSSSFPFLSLSNETIPTSPSPSSCFTIASNPCFYACISTLSIRSSLFSLLSLFLTLSHSISLSLYPRFFFLFFSFLTQHNYHSGTMGKTSHHTQKSMILKPSTANTRCIMNETAITDFPIAIPPHVQCTTVFDFRSQP